MEDRLWIAKLARGIIEDVQSVRSALHDGAAYVRQPIPDVLDILDTSKGETVPIRRRTLMDIAENVIFLSGRVEVALRHLGTIQDKSRTIANN